MNKLLSAILLAALLLQTCACSSNSGNSVKNEASSDITNSSAESAEVRIITPTIYLLEGESYVLKYEAEQDDTEINWISSTDCVSVDNGVVTAEKEGFARINGNEGNECLVIVLSKKLSTISIDTKGSSITSRDTYVSAKVSVDSKNNDHDLKNVSAGVRLRGNSTFYTPQKKAYRIKFDKKTNILGMNEGAECKSWVLLAEWFDDTYLRDPVAYSIGAALLDEYTTDFRYVKLNINGKYMGVYILAEQSQIHPERVNIEEAGEKSSSLMSGYMFEVNSSDVFDSNKSFKLYHDPYEIITHDGKLFTANCGLDGDRAHYMTLKNNGFSKSQLAFSKYYLRAVFEILYQATYNGKAYEFKYDFLNDPSKASKFLTSCNNSDNHMSGLTESKTKTPREAIEAVIDIDSLVNTYILNQIICNADAVWRSFYFWVDLSEGGTKKLTFGCPWDHDGATVTWSTFDYRPTDEYFDVLMNPWLSMPMVNDWFKELVRDRWQEVYEKTNGFDTVLKMIKDVTDAYADEFKAEQKLWGRAEAQSVQSENTYNWFVERIKWLNSEFGEL